MWLLSVLGFTYGVIIDSFMISNGHDRRKIDGINEFDKSYLIQKMCMIG